jgi:cellulose synthase/poly-beta-1,6-N-acetylglucosamine synthase-like glycosyltransferase
MTTPTAPRTMIQRVAGRLSASDSPTARRLLMGSAPTRLPSPPTDDERALYFGPQHRWVPMLSFVSSVLVILSITLLVTQRTWALVLTVPTGLNAIGTGISLVSSCRRRRYNYASHRARVETWEPDYIPAVDVFLPTAGEDLGVLRNTYEHVARLQWHGDRLVTVLDDADRAEVHELAESYGFAYHVRPDRGRLKKAGNLLAGFQRTRGDFILVLDADFVPRPDLFYELLPYMDDPVNAVVQSPQYFDCDNTMGWVQKAAGATQVLFYRWIQPSRDRSDAAICVGTSAVYRRAALERIGGFAQISHSEDVHTGVKLMAAGYRVRYVPVLVTKGLCPDSFDQFVTQQYRWCTGSMSLMLSKAFHRHPFTFMQRISYWSGFLYYITTGMNVFAIAVPPILMAALAPGAVNPTNYGLVMLALALRAVVVPVITMGRASMFDLARIQMTYSFSHAVALFDQIRGRTDAWVATGNKARSRTATRVGNTSRRWCIGVQVALWAVLAWRIPRYGIANYWPLLALTALNLLLVAPIITRRRVRSLT